jgi:hypothetical protein
MLNCGRSGSRWFVNFVVGDPRVAKDHCGTSQRSFPLAGISTSVKAFSAALIASMLQR